MFDKARSLALRNTAVVSLLAVGASLTQGALALTIDVTDVTAAITDAVTAIATVGAAVLVMLVGAKVYKWIRRAM